MRNFVEIPGKELTRDAIKNVVGKDSSVDFDDVCKALKHFKAEGEHVYFLFDDCCF